MLTKDGVNVSASGPQLIVTLKGFRTTESIWHRSSYDAQIAVNAQLQSASGKACWQDSIEGKSGSYGYSGSIADYQEALNGALDKAALNILDAPNFKTAVCSCQSVGARLRA